MIAKRIFQTGAVQIVTLVLGVLTGIFVSRLLGPEGRGVYAVFKANSEFLVLLAGFGMGSVVTYYVSNKEIKLKELFGLSIIGGTCSILFVSIILLVTFNTPLKGLFFPEGYQQSWFFMFLLGLFSLGIVRIIMTGFLNGRKHFTDTNMVKAGNALILLGFVVSLYFYFGEVQLSEKVKSVLLSLVVASLLAAIILSTLFYKRYRNDLAISFDVKKSFAIVFGFVNLVYFGELVNFFNYRLDIWLVEYFESSYQLGLYSLAVSVSQMLWLIAIPVTVVLLPYLNNPDLKEEGKRLFFFIQESRLLLPQSPHWGYSFLLNMLFRSFTAHRLAVQFRH